MLHHGDAAESLGAKQNKWRGSWPTGIASRTFVFILKVFADEMPFDDS